MKRLYVSGSIVIGLAMIAFIAHAQITAPGCYSYSSSNGAAWNQICPNATSTPSKPIVPPIGVFIGDVISGMSVYKITDTTTGVKCYVIVNTPSISCIK